MHAGARHRKESRYEMSDASGYGDIRDLAFLKGGGEAGAQIRAVDWAAHPLGPPERWPQPLKTSVSLMLATGHPICLSWGSELSFLYNDAYAPILTSRHPAALGKPFAEVWSDVWPAIAPLVDQALVGEAVWQDDMHLVMLRGDQLVDTWWTFSYSPLRDEQGNVCGFINICNDTTDRVVKERQLDDEREVLRNSEERFRALVNASSDVVYRMSPDWRQMRALDGRGFLADTEKPSVNWIDEYLFPEDLPAILAAIDDAVRTKGTFELEHRVRAVDGGVGWTFSRAVPLLGADGEIVEWFGMASDVTERHRIQQRLVESEHAMRFALKAGRLGTWSLDLQTGELITSEICRLNFGRDPALRFSYEELRAAVHPDDQSRMMAAVEHSIADHVDYDIEYRLITPAGDTRWIAIRAQPSYAEDGTPIRMDGVSADITDRKETEAALAASQATLRAVYDNTPAGLIVAEWPSGRLVESNRSVEDIFRHPMHPTESFDDYSVWESYDSAGRRTDGHDYPLAQTLKTGENAEGTYHFVRGDGTRAWLRVQSAPIRDASGTMTGGVVAVTDVDEMVRTREELEALTASLEADVAERTGELRQFQAIVEATTSPICAFDRDFRLIAFNKAHNDEFRRVNGFDTKVGDIFPDLFIPEQGKVMRALMARALSGEHFTINEEFGRPEFGQPLWEISYTPLRNASGDVVGAFHLATDMSDRLRAEAELAVAQEALRQSQKMEAMGSLTGGVAHDFNNLLTPIIGSLDLLQRKGLGTAREQRLIDGALQSAERAKLLVQRLLAFARRQPLQPEAVDVASLVEGMAELIASTSGPRIRFEVQIAPDLPPAQADANQIEMAILNLAVNARDAMPDGGCLTIVAENELVEDEHRAGLPPGSYVRLSVADTGIGMDEETLARATEPFFSTKGIGKGTGLGLSMVHGLVAQLGGGFAISSRAGLGTEVELWLPASVNRVENDANHSDDEGARQSGLALIVDDEELVRASTGDMLLELGYEVREASSAEEALELLGEGLSPDILVTDHLMPNMTGTELVRHVREIRPEIPALIISGYADVEGIAADLPRLVKPFRQAELANAVAGLVRADEPRPSNT